MNIEILENYRDNEDVRNLFFEFTPNALYGANFKKWYELGYWANRYKPFSIVTEGKMVANVSISELDIYLDSKRMKALQFATVGTLPKYQNKGYSRYLMEYVLSKYENEVDLFYLFANDSVIDFYPKFGFERKFETLFKSNLKKDSSKCELRKLNFSSEQDLNIIKELLKVRQPITKQFSPIDYDFITMWHIIYLYQNNLYYLEREDIVFILNHSGKELHLFDIVAREKIDFELISRKIIPNMEIAEIFYHFSPDQIGLKDYVCIPDDESILFVRGDFPINDGKFKYPITGQT